MSVLAESLYSQMPMLTAGQREKLDQQYSKRRGGSNDPMVGGGRKLLMFSDSRQNAAFLASYLQDNTREFLLRELAWEGLQCAAREGATCLPLEGWGKAIQKVAGKRDLSVPYLKERDITGLEPAQLFQNSYDQDPLSQKESLLEFLLHEVSGSGPLTLEAVGLAEVFVRLPATLQANPGAPWFTDWPGGPVTKAELAELLARLLRLLRRGYLLTCPNGIERPGFSVKQPYLVLQRTEQLPNFLHGLLPVQERDTSYTDLLRRWSFCRAGKEPTAEQVRQLGHALFQWMQEHLAGSLKSDLQEGCPPWHCATMRCKFVYQSSFGNAIVAARSVRPGSRVSVPSHAVRDCCGKFLWKNFLPRSPIGTITRNAT